MKLIVWPWGLMLQEDASARTVSLWLNHFLLWCWNGWQGARLLSGLLPEVKVWGCRRVILPVIAETASVSKLRTRRGYQYRVERIIAVLLKMAIRALSFQRKGGEIHRFFISQVSWEARGKMKRKPLKRGWEVEWSTGRWQRLEDPLILLNGTFLSKRFQGPWVTLSLILSKKQNKACFTKNYWVLTSETPLQ